MLIEVSIRIPVSARVMCEHPKGKDTGGKKSTFQHDVNGEDLKPILAFADSRLGIKEATQYDHKEAKVMSSTVVGSDADRVEVCVTVEHNP